MFRKINWHLQGLVDKNGPLEPPEDGGGWVEQLQQAPLSSSVQTAPLTTRIPERLRSRSSEQNPPAHSTTGESKSHTRGHKKENLGLRLVSDNPAHNGDLIFVHGLGGNATTTWCWDRDPKYFWPSWLANEENLSSYRVFTFGYNSNLAGTDTNLNIVDFAKDLLLQMLTFSGGLRKKCRPIGDRDIIFVCHSMGGLVVKKAFVLGKHDLEFSRILSRVYGIVFLATPHRGSQYVKTLNLILSSIPMVTSGKSYVADLDPKSTALQDINEQFRTACEGLKLFSFVETLKTKGLEIVPKECGILGYPNENSTTLQADHHTICKFRSPEDANFTAVRDVLSLWGSRLRSKRRLSHSQLPTNELDVPKKLEAMLGISEGPEDDLHMIRNRVIRGTCQWIRNRSEFVEWFEAPVKQSDPQTLWLIGLPATGKTALVSTVVDHIHSLGHESQYHFFSADHQIKRTAAYCLRSIAYQLARSNESFEEKLLALYDSSGITFKSQKQNFDSIWETIFEGIIFKMTFPTTLYWVLDAVDEADSHQMLLGRLLKICSRTPIKLFFSSRPIRIPSRAAAYGSSITTLFLSEEDTNGDIRTYVQSAVRDSLPEDEEIQRHIVGQILMKASGSFLWTKLAIEMLRDHWHTQEDIDEILNGIPEGMESLYCRMLDEVRSQPLRFQLMAQRIITWAACAWRPLSIDELRIALEPEFKGFVSLEDTIVQICGHFVFVDHSKISLIHITARQFLLESKHGGSSFVNKSKAHEHIATVSLNYLSNDVWRHTFMACSSPNGNDQTRRTNNRLLVIERSHPFLLYATYYWAYHVSKSPVDSEPLGKVLRSFLTRYCFSWIEGASLSSSLHHLTRSAKHLKIFAKRIRNIRHKNLESLLSLRAVEEDLAHDIQSWAIDLIRIVGKFGPNLVQRPSSIYRLVPPFCPRNSNIGKLHHNGSDQIMSVTGLPCEGWDDCLATVSVGEDGIASKVLATDAYFFVLISGSGTIIVWHSETCEEARRMHHEEYVPHMVLNRSGTLLATAGVYTYRVWDISSGQELYCLQKGTSSITLAVAFGNHDSELVVGLDDCSITGFDLENKKEAWRFLAKDPHEDCNGCPRLMKFSPDLTKVAIAWRGRPLMVWDMTIRMYQQPMRCRVTGNTDTMCAPESIEWQKDGTSILVLCQNAKLVEWRLYDDERVDFSHVTAREMTISSDTNLLLTSDNLGTLSIWTFPRLNLIYQLTSTDGFIRSLAFSPDGQRFYDTRQSMCKIWEPEVLVRPDDTDLEDHSSVGGISTATEAITAHDECGRVSITALVPDAEGKYYCCGREDGTITIHEALEGNRVRKVYSHASSSSVIALNWSHSGRYMVSSDDSGRVISKRLEVKGPSKWSVFPVLDIRLDEPVEQFLFNTTERLLLISTSSTDIVCDLKLKKEVCRQRWRYRQSRRWVDHPENSNLLVWVDTMEVRTYTWTELNPTGTFHTSLSTSNYTDPINLSTGPNFGELVGPHLLELPAQSLAVAESRRYIIYGILSSTSRNSSNSAASLRLHFLSTSNFSVEQPHQPVTDHMTDFAGQVKLLLGTYRDFVVFLDHDYWVCTWKINADLNAVQKHFFLPRDWLSPSTLQMAVLDAQGAVLCPKHGCVAIIRNGIRF